MRNSVKKQKTPSTNIKKRYQEPMPENFEFGLHVGSIFEAKIDQKTLKNRSQNGCKICMHFGIDFVLIFIDLGAQDGPPRGANEGPTNQLFRSKIRPGPPRRPKTAQDPPKTDPRATLDRPRGKKTAKKKLSDQGTGSAFKRWTLYSRSGG